MNLPNMKKYVRQILESGYVMKIYVTGNLDQSYVAKVASLRIHPGNAQIDLTSVPPNAPPKS